MLDGLYVIVKPLFIFVKMTMLGHKKVHMLFLHHNVTQKHENRKQKLLARSDIFILKFKKKKG